MTHKLNPGNAIARNIKHSLKNDTGMHNSETFHVIQAIRCSHQPQSTAKAWCLLFHRAVKCVGFMMSVQRLCLLTECTASKECDGGKKTHIGTKLKQE